MEWVFHGNRMHVGQNKENECGDDEGLNNVSAVYSSRILIDEPVAKKMVNDDVIKGVVLRKDDKGTLVEAMGRELLVPPHVQIMENEGETCSFKVEINQEEGVRLRYEPSYKGHQTTKTGGQSYMKAWLKKQNLTNFHKDTIRSISQMKQDDQLAFQRLIKETKEQIDKIMDKAEDEDIMRLLTKGMSPEKVTVKVFEHAISTGKQEGKLEKESLRDIVDKELERLAKIFGSKEEMRSIVKQLKEKNLPVTEANIMKIRGALNKYDAIKNLSDESILNILKNNISLTVDKLYEAKFSSGQVLHKEQGYGGNMTTKGPLTEETLRHLEPQIKTMLEKQGLATSEEHMKIAKAFIRNDIDINEENIKAYKELKQLATDTDRGKIIAGGARNILEDRPVGEITLGEAAINGRDPQKTYEEYVKMLPKVEDRHLQKLVGSGQDIHLRNLQRVVQEVDDAVTSVDRGRLESLNRDQQQQLITAKRQIEEIRLKMTIESAHRLYKQDIEIDTAPLEKVVEGLRQLEEEGIRQSLVAVGINQPTAEQVNEMQVVLSAVEDLKESGNQVLGKVYSKEIPYTLSGLHEEASTDQLSRQQSVAMYEKLGTKPRGDLGDHITKAFSQLEGILKDIGIQPTPENLRSAKILAETGIDISKASINQITLLDQKVTAVLSKLHPNMVAQMMKDQVSPLNQTVDEVLQYMDDFNEAYGEELTERIAKYIHAMDKEGNLTQQERDSMIGIYRMLHTIEKSEGKAVGFLAKNNMKLTLNNLMEAAKYIQRTGGKREDINISVDDDFGGLEQLRYHGRPIIEQIQEAFQKANMSTTRGNMALAEAMRALDLEITAEGLIDMKQMEHKVKELIQKATPSALRKTLNTKDIMDKPIEEVLDQLEGHQDEWAIDTTRIRQQLKVAKEASSKAIDFLEKLQLPINLKNLHTMGQLMEDNHILGKTLKKLLDTSHLQDASSADEVKGIISEIVEGIGNGDGMDDAYNKLEEKISELQDEHRLQVTGEESVDYMCTDIKCMLHMNQIMSKEERFYQIPIVLGNEVSQLNMYYVNDSKESSEPTSILLSLDTKHLGKVNAYATIDNNSIHMQLSSSIEGETGYMEQFRNGLEDMLRGMGYEEISLAYGKQSVKSPIDVTEEPVTITQVKHDAGQFERRI